MTENQRKWAIEEIENNILPDACDEVAERALGYAIEALSQPERPKGRWILEAHKEKANYRWNVTAECSECCEEPREIWAGFFPNVPDCIAKEVALNCAKSIKTNNFCCPNCGSDNRGEE